MITWYLDKKGRWRDIRALERRRSRLTWTLIAVLAAIATFSVLFNLYFFAAL